MPDEKFIFPVSVNRNFKFKLNWINDFQDYVILICKVLKKCVNIVLCVIIILPIKMRRKTELMVIKPLDKWKNAIEIFNTHSCIEYHEITFFSLKMLFPFIATNSKILAKKLILHVLIKLLEIEKKTNVGYLN